MAFTVWRITVNLPIYILLIPEQHRISYLEYQINIFMYANQNNSTLYVNKYIYHKQISSETYPSFISLHLAGATVNYFLLFDY